jgi:hypothetical protein
MRRQTRRLVRKHRDKIECVAAALLERWKLEPDEMDTLIAREPQSRAGAFRLAGRSNVASNEICRMLPQMLPRAVFRVFSASLILG